MRILVGVLLVLGLSTAWASDDTPWGKGVSPAQRAAAEKQLGEGNALFLAGKFREALAKYEQSISSWDHPAIRFNIVRCLIALDRPLEAWQNLERALAFGKAPFEEAIYTEAINYQRLLAGQIAELEVTCKQAGVEVKVDGERFVSCPGTKAKQTLPGTHVIVATKPGFMTQTKDAVLLPGKKQPIVIELVTIEQGTVYKPRWSTWKPWAIVGGGVVVTGLGVLFDRQARGELAQLARAVESSCPADGCTREQYDALAYERTESAAIQKNRIAIGVMAAGGAIVVGGVIAVIMNRPRPVAIERRERSATITPTLSPAGAGIAVRGAF